MVARVELPIASSADFAELRRRFTSLPLRPKLMQGREAGTLGFEGFWRRATCR